MRLLATGLFLAVLFFTPSIGHSDDGWRFPTDRITEQQWQLYLEETLAIPNISFMEGEGQLAIEVREELTIYVFTTPAHPAHPAVVKRQAISRDGAWYMDRKGHYAGDRAEFDHWWHQFDELDRQMRDAIMNEKGVTAN